MPLITCPECGREISDKAQSCPGCGWPVDLSELKQNEPQKQNTILECDVPQNYRGRIVVTNRDKKSGTVTIFCDSCKNAVNLSESENMEVFYNTALFKQDYACSCGKTVKAGAFVPRIGAEREEQEELNELQRIAEISGNLHIPKCPVCGSTKIEKISGASKVASFLAFGVLSAKKLTSTFRCRSCGYKF